MCCNIILPNLGTVIAIAIIVFIAIIAFTYYKKYQFKKYLIEIDNSFSTIKAGDVIEVWCHNYYGNYWKYNFIIKKIILEDDEYKYLCICSNSYIEYMELTKKDFIKKYNVFRVEYKYIINTTHYERIRNKSQNDLKSKYDI